MWVKTLRVIPSLCARLPLHPTFHRTVDWLQALPLHFLVLPQWKNPFNNCLSSTLPWIFLTSMSASNSMPCLPLFSLLDSFPLLPPPLQPVRFFVGEIRLKGALYSLTNSIYILTIWTKEAMHNEWEVLLWCNAMVSPTCLAYIPS